MAGIEAFLSSAAAAGLEAAGSRPGGMLANTVAAFAARGPAPGLYLLGAAGCWAACEVVGRQGGPVLVVYAVGERAELVERLVGVEIATATRGLAVRAALRRSPRPAAPRV